MQPEVIPKMREKFRKMSNEDSSAAIIKETFTSEKKWRILKKDSLYILLTSLLIPIFYYFEVFIVLPKIYQEWCVMYFFHILISIFLLYNVSSNMIFGMFSDTSIHGKFLQNKRTQSWSICTLCETYVPLRSWHCKSCDICILKRDHHCNFFGTCIGYFNHRYFCMFVIYIFASMIYSFYFNILFVSETLNWNNGLLLLRFIMPFMALGWDPNIENIFVLLIVINFIVMCFTAFLLGYHSVNVFQGKTTPEAKKENNFEYNFGWKNNLRDVFGTKWYIAWISPFIVSPLIHDGINWNERVKSE